MVTALLVSALSCLASALATDWHLLLFRALTGLALSGLATVGTTYLAEEIHPNRLGFAMGLYVAGNAIGGMSGRLIASVVVDFVSWRTTLGILGVIALLVTLLFWYYLPPSRNFHPHRLNLRSLLLGYLVHFHDRGLPLLFMEGFLLMDSFVTLFNYIGYRLLAPPYQLSQTWVGCISIVYLSGIYSSTFIGSLSERIGRKRLLAAMILVMLAGVLITLLPNLWLIIPGILLLTFGFFGAHSIASSWVSKRAKVARAQAPSLYLFFYYVDSSIASTLSDYFWHLWCWPGVALFIVYLLVVGQIAAWHLSLVPPRHRMTA